MIFPSEKFIEQFKKVNGALSVCESISIINLAAKSPQGKYLELGTHYGKSAMSASYSLKPGIFYLVDPIFKEAKICEQVIDTICEVNKENAVVFDDGVSIDAIPRHNNYSWVFVDSGSHQDGLPLEEVKLLEDRMVQGGIIAFHDWDSQFKEVKEASDYLVSTGKYEYVPIEWEKIVEYVRENDLENGNLSWHHNEIYSPCFVGAVRKK